MSCHALAGSLRLENRGSPDATNRTLRNEDSAQQGVSSLPLHAQITACSLHSGGEGGSQKQVRESACQFYRIDAASVCTRAFMKSVMANKLHVFLASKNAPYVPTTANGVECPHISRVNVAGQKQVHVFAIWYQKHRSRKSFCTHCASLRVTATVMSSNQEIFLDSRSPHGTLKR